MLKNNVEVFGMANITTMNGNFCEMIPDMPANAWDVVFLDPPWGGVDYKVRYILCKHF